MESERTLLKFVAVFSGYNGLHIIRNLTFSVKEGQFWAVMGPNGSGKTTLLRTAIGEIPADSGTTLLDGRPISEWDRTEIGRLVAYVPQDMVINPAMQVFEYVSLGRYPYIGAFRSLSDKDRYIVERSLEQVDALPLRNRFLSELSMGELQRIRLARALAQEPKLLILDEPLAHLDPSHRFEVLKFLSDLTEVGISILAAIHEVEMAYPYIDHVIFLTKDHSNIVGHKNEKFNEEIVRQVFDVESKFFMDRLVLLPKESSE